MKLLHHIVIIVIVFVSSSGYLKASDQAEIDSLNQVISSTENDSIRIATTLELCNYYYLELPDSTIKILLDALHDAEVLNNKKLISDATYWLGYMYHASGEFNRSIDYYSQSLPYLVETKDAYWVGTVRNNIAVAYRDMGELDSARAYLNAAAASYQSIDDTASMATIYHNIGLIYDSEGNLEKALEYYGKGLSWKKGVDISGSLMNIGNIYLRMGEDSAALSFFRESYTTRAANNHVVGMSESLIFIARVHKDNNQKDSALVYANKSLDLATQASSKKRMAVAMNLIGELYSGQNNLDSALYYFEQSYLLRKSIDDKPGMVYPLTNISKIELKLNAVAAAEKHAKLALALADEIGFAEHIKSAELAMYKVDKRLQNWDKALGHYERFILFRDSLKNEENQKAAIRQQTQYEFEKNQLIKEQKEKELARIAAEKVSRRNNLQYSVILIAILIVFGSVLALGFVSVSQKVAEGLIFFAFLIFFEFLLVLTDPYMDSITDGEPMYKLLANALLAALIFPAHAFFERLLKSRLLKGDAQ